MLGFAVKFSLFLALALAAQFAVSLEYGFDPPSVGLPKAEAYHPDSQILAFQGYMKTDPDLGFLFKENLGADGSLKLRWADQDPGQLTTDEVGFVNTPFALEAKREGKRIQIIGVGSSFMQGAAGKLHEYFWAKGLFYYNMATPRHSLAQFTTAVKHHAVPAHPDWILYDLNETSLDLIRDYEDWSRSGLDWFAYHSGTWCGPPRKGALPMLESFPALQAIYRGMRRKAAPEKPIPKASDAETADKAVASILEAREAARRAGIGFLVVAIPSRDASVYGSSERWKVLESTFPRLEKAGVRVLDLRQGFSTEEDPRALYYHVDAHWNDYGIFKAGMAISQYLANADSSQSNMKRKAANL